MPLENTICVRTNRHAHRTFAMSSFRFSLLELAGLVALVAVCCAALAYASPLVSGIVWSATFLILAFAAIATVLRSQPQRSWWIGFTIIGWLYVLALTGPLSGLGKFVDSNGLLEKAARQMPNSMVTIPDPFAGSGRAAVGLGLGGMGGNAGMSGMPGGMGDVGLGIAPATYQAVNSEYMTAFVRTSQALLTLLLACLGGFSGQWMHERNRTCRKDSAAPTMASRRCSATPRSRT